MNQPLQRLPVIVLGIFFHACTSNVGSADDNQPDPNPGIIQPEWEVFQRSPDPNGNAEAWGLDIYNGNIYWAVSQIMPGTQMDIFLQQYPLDGSKNWSENVVSKPFTDQAYFLALTDSTAYIEGRTCRQAVDIQSCDALVAKADAATGTPASEISWDQGFGCEEVDGIGPAAIRIARYRVDVWPKYRDGPVSSEI